jgi:hypothetical protein
MSDTAYCTIVTKSHLCYARALAVTLTEHNPDSTLFVLLADSIDGYFEPDKEPFQLITLQELSDQEDIHRMCFYYNAIEMCFVLRAWLHEYMLQKTKFRKWIYLDADIAVYHSFQTVSTHLDNTSILLTPHLISIQTPDAIDEKAVIRMESHLLRSGGIYQGGFLAVRRSEESYKFVNWFKDRLRYYGFNARPMQSGDQFWMTYIPLYFVQVSVLRYPGANLAYWNLYERNVNQDDSRNILVDGQPLLFFHFAGYDFNTPHELSKYALPRGLKIVPTPIMELAQNYRQLVLKNGYNETRKYPYGFAKFNSGEAITPSMRRLYFEQIYRGKGQNGSPFEQYEFLKSQVRFQEIKHSIRKAGRDIMNQIRKRLSPEYNFKVL